MQGGCAQLAFAFALAPAVRMALACWLDARCACLVMSCAPADLFSLPTGCGHCKRLVPEYSKLGEKIASDPKLKNRVLIAKVRSFCELFWGCFAGKSAANDRMRIAKVRLQAIDAGTAPIQYTGSAECCYAWLLGGPYSAPAAWCAAVHTTVKLQNVLISTSLHRWMPTRTAPWARSLACAASPRSSGSPAASPLTPWSEWNS